ncbi:MAG: hypothetical protein OXD54_18890 [Candidatus Poribacteria bacterium]|nr:hypothetical protein [Candidatus Poribacteria bacterium]
MYRDIFSNKWVLGGVGFLIILSVACVLWYQHDTTAERQAAADTEKLLPQSDIAKMGSEMEQVSDAPMDSINQSTKIPVTETTLVPKDTELIQAPNETNYPVENAETSSDVQVSTYGFGPYPKVPEDYPIPPTKFRWEFWGKTRKGELMSRVRIKLWKEGVKSEGATFRNGKVYPNILGTVYVEWDGEIIRRMTGHPDDDFDAIEAALEAGQPPPEGITVLNTNEAGIDPYTFLELKQKE